MGDCLSKSDGTKGSSSARSNKYRETPRSTNAASASRQPDNQRGGPPFNAVDVHPDSRHPQQGAYPDNRHPQQQGGHPSNNVSDGHQYDRRSQQGGYPEYQQGYQNDRGPKDNQTPRSRDGYDQLSPDEKKHKGKNKRHNKEEKLEKENRQLKQDYDQLNNKYQQLENGYGKLTEDYQHTGRYCEQLKERNKQLGQEANDNESTIKRYKQQEAGLKQTIDQLRNDNDELRNRLSSMAGAILTDNNPNIADLSDANRPTKLAEKYSELYDNEWTEAFQLLNEDVKLSEQDSIQQLLSAFLELNELCVNEAREQLEQLTKAMAPFQESGSYSPEVLKQLKDTRKRMYDVHLKNLQPHVETLVRSILAKHSVNDKTLRTFLMKCLQLSWLMAIQDPPVYVNKRVVRDGEKLDKAEFKVYTQSGKYIAFIVWPTVYLHEGGPMLCKGIAQGQGKEDVKFVPNKPPAKADVKTGKESKTTVATSSGRGTNEQIPDAKRLGSKSTTSDINKQGTQSLYAPSDRKTSSEKENFVKTISGASPAAEKTKSATHKQQQSHQKQKAPEKPRQRTGLDTNTIAPPSGNPTSEVDKQSSRYVSGASSAADQPVSQPKMIGFKEFKADQSRDARSPNTAGPKSEAQQPKHKSVISHKM